MKFLRIILALLFVAAIGSITFRSEALTFFGLSEIGLSWTGSFLFPRLLVLLFTVGLLWVVRPFLGATKMKKALFSFLILVVGIGGYLIVNPPYLEDMRDSGTAMEPTPEAIPIEESLQQTHPDFDGVICMALPGCPHCKAAMPRLALMQKRVPGLDVMVYVFTKNQMDVTAYEKFVNVPELTYQALPDSEVSIKLCKGVFPAYLYFKDGKVVYRWFNSEFGFPALDRIENRLE